MLRGKIKKTIYYLFSIRFRDVYEVVNLIIESLTEQELNVLETKYKGETISFRDQMLIECFYKYPIIGELKDIRSKIEEVILRNKFLFKVNNVQRVREFFLKDLLREIFLDSGLYDLRCRWNFISRGVWGIPKATETFDGKKYFIKSIGSELLQHRWGHSTTSSRMLGSTAPLHIGTKQNGESLMYQLVCRSENHYYSVLLLTSFKEVYIFTYIGGELIEKMGYSDRFKISPKDISNFIREKKIRLQQYKARGKIDILEADSLLRDFIEYISEKDLKMNLGNYGGRFWCIVSATLIMIIAFGQLLKKFFDDYSMKGLIG